MADTKTAQVERKAVPAGKQRGNTPLPIAGTERVKLPDEYDVIWNGVIVGRSTDENEREEILLKAQALTQT